MTKRTVLLGTLLALVMAASQAPGQFISRDPGVRGGPAGAGQMIEGLTDTLKAVFAAGAEDFAEEDTLASGLGHDSISTAARGATRSRRSAAAARG